MSPDLNDAELERYGRHVMLDEIGIEGQGRLNGSHVVMIGAGGLGCPAALYLAASGVGSVTIVDDDVVEASNLQRQILFQDPDIGKPKAEIAAQALEKTNPHVTVNPICERANPDNLERIISPADLVLDGTDNFATKHAINKACHAQGVDLVCGAAEKFDGQVCVFGFATDKRPCYSCIFPLTDAAPATTPCALLGVFAPLTGTIGSLMASEAIRLLATIPGSGLRSRMLAYDALEQRTRVIAVKADNSCPVCGS